MLMIFVHHCDFLYGGGYCAVAGFFIISGFCMYLGYGEKGLEKDFSWTKFMLRRAIKIYPVHWIALLLMWMIFNVHVMTICYVHFEDGFPSTLLLNAALLQSWIPKESIYFSYNSPSWYLCNILFFAAVFPYINRVIERSSTICKSLLLILPVILILLLAFILPVDMRHAYLYINPVSRVVDCIIGIYAAKFYLRQKENLDKNNYSMYAVVADVAVVILFCIVLMQSIFYADLGFDKWYYTIYWIPEIALLLAVAIRSLFPVKTLIGIVLNNKIVNYIGASSLSFYILHVPIMNALRKIYPECGCDAKNLIGGAIALAVTLLVSRISYLLIEVRLTKFLNKKLLNT